MTDTTARFRVYDQQKDRCQIGEFRFLIQRRVGTHSIDVWTTIAAAHDHDTAQMICEQQDEYEEYRDEVARIDGDAA